MIESSAALPIRENIPLAPYTTLGVGGAARFLIAAKTEEHIHAALKFSQSHGCPAVILGGGSNLVVSDSGFPGLVIKMELSGLRHERDSGKFSAAAGVEWDCFVQQCVAENLAGVECLSGIPGTVGGAPLQNIGAYGQEAGEVIARITVLDRNSGCIQELTGADCQFSYRSSIFNTTHKDRFIIMKVEFSLRTDGVPCIRYPDIRMRFADGAYSPSLGDVREAVLQARRAKSMVLNANDPDAKSAGSFFKNPVLNTEAMLAMETDARRRGKLGPSEFIPRFPALPGKEKLPAAWLIEKAGFHKGYVHKNAGLSNKHALAIVNRGGASAQDIVDLMRLIQTRVEDTFGIALQPEPVFIGFEK